MGGRAHDLKKVNQITYVTIRTQKKGGLFLARKTQDLILVKSLGMDGKAQC